MCRIEVQRCHSSNLNCADFLSAGKPVLYSRRQVQHSVPAMHAVNRNECASVVCVSQESAQACDRFSANEEKVSNKKQQTLGHHSVEMKAVKFTVVTIHIILSWLHVRTASLHTW